MDVFLYSFFMSLIKQISKNKIILFASQILDIGMFLRITENLNCACLLAWNIRSPAGSLVHQYACGNDFVNFTASINALGSHAIYGEKNISDDVPPMH